jgi:biopolymer transport protein ExbD
MKYLPLLLAAALAAATNAGCMTKTRIPARSASRSAVRPDDIGIQVLLNRNGSLMLYNNEISRERLVRRLIDEEKCDKGNRAVMLEDGPGVELKELAAMREYLVRNRIPRVVLVTRPTVSAEISQDAPFFGHPQ